MNKENVLKVFTGTTVNATTIKERLQEAGINATLRDDYFSRDVIQNKNQIPEKLDVYIDAKDLASAQQIIEEVYIDIMK